MLRRVRPLFLLPACLGLLGLLALLPERPTAPGDDPVPRLYAPGPGPAALAQYHELAARGDASADGLLALANTPRAVWFGDAAPEATEREVRRVVSAAERDGSLPVLVLYNVPGRDCGRYSRGGTDTTTAYTVWTEAVARGIGTRRALVVLEPDGLALLPSDCGPDGGAASRTEERYASLAGAVGTLEPLPATRVYVDAGHSAWHPVPTVVARLLRAGVGRATGFALNVSNHRTDEDTRWYGDLIASCLAYAESGGDPVDCPDRTVPRARARAWLAAHAGTPSDRMKHYVTDSGRNGRGPWTPPAGRYPDPQDWCNPPGRGLGAPPTTATGHPLHDARLWIKAPGESDGPCLRGTAGPLDPERGTAGPPAGQWFPDQALELVRLANPAVPPAG
ncbi:glycoside hydrolase family 6 protein [Streptomyces sp. NBC_01216]|uniref:glycoside hydrolase family 6 protein n=1 Tax=unclassified Streptomyces TaxID=2593676 RepID=UPI002E0E6DE2|nr:glycoside hydrolase family 6 protein [Streptomyces sp. NBC_01216]